MSYRTILPAWYVIFVRKSHIQSVCNISDHLNDIQDKEVPKAVMEVIEEEINKLGFLDNHSMEFK